MGVRDRLRDPVALVIASGSFVAGVAVTLSGPWPWLAGLAGPTIPVVVLLIATEPPPLPPPPDPPRMTDFAALIGEWAGRQDDAGALDGADDARRLARRAAELEQRCTRRIDALEGEEERRHHRAQVRAIIDTVAASINFYVQKKTFPGSLLDWTVIADELRTAIDHFQAELDLIPGEE
jgi:hypothetical protein